MGKSSLGGKVRISSSSRQQHDNNISNSNNFETDNFDPDDDQFDRQSSFCPNQSNVRDLIEKLKYLKPRREDIMKLESVKAVLSALEDSHSKRNYSTEFHDTTAPDIENVVSPSSSLQGSKSISFTSSKFEGAGMSRSNGGTGSGIKGQSSKYNNMKHGSGGGDSASVMMNDTKTPSTDTNTTTTTAASDKITTTAKKGCATVIRNFENLYKTVAKKYFFMLKPRKPSKSNFFGVFFSILALIFYFELHTINGFSRLWLKWENVDLSSVECTIESPNLAMEVFRPPVSCSICHNIKSADRVSSISPAEFEKVYAYTGKPVVVTDAMTNWTAPSAFAFEFFKGIYSEGSRSLVHLDEDCLFFPYQTEFRNLAEVFNMTKERFNRRWYIGWSNCDAETSHILRQHYQRPYFLPETAESTHADWIFMGTPGWGAHMHIDHVINPSWQGQIKGFKRWHLQPPPECFYECQSFHVDVHPGDIIVLDTNKWYHQTEILSGENSITIGSEYD